jgi:hypothetical protein
MCYRKVWHSFGIDIRQLKPITYIYLLSNRPRCVVAQCKTPSGERLVPKIYKFFFRFHIQRIEMKFITMLIKIYKTPWLCELSFIKDNNEYSKSLIQQMRSPKPCLIQNLHALWPNKVKYYIYMMNFIIFSKS